jgi:hypothetical protein
MSAAISFSNFHLARPVPLHVVLRQRNAVGGVSLPVNPSLGYIRFKHVRGVPAQGGAGLSLDKLKMVDNLLERLSHDPQLRAKLQGNAAELPIQESDAMDRRLMDLARQLHERAQDIEPAAYAPVSENDAGLLFSVTV